MTRPERVRLPCRGLSCYFSGRAATIYEAVAVGLMIALCNRKTGSNQVANINNRVGPLCEKYNFLLLFVALVFSCVGLPILQYYDFDSLIIMNVGLTVILVLGTIGSFSPRLLLFFGLPTLLVALGFTWTSVLVERPWLLVTNCLLQGACFIVMAVLILYRVFTRHLATRDSMLGAICGYLLVGLCWTMLYRALNLTDPESFQFGHHLTVLVNGTGQTTTAFAQLVYFSFVTMSTLGYGDITPQTPPALVLTWTQSVIGQFYLAILVARLVGVLPAARSMQTDFAATTENLPS